MDIKTVSNNRGLSTVAVVSNVSADVEDLELCFSHPVPSWIQGRIIRVGPGVFDLGSTSVGHYFDGLSVLFSVNFGDQATFTLKRLRTYQSDLCVKNNEFCFEGFDQPLKPFPTFLARMKLALLSNKTPGIGFENANINIFRMNDQFAAVGESNKMFEFDPKTLNTIGAVQSKSLKGIFLATPHPLVCPEDGKVYNLHETPFSHQFVRYSCLEDFEVLATFGRGRPFYSHSFGLTPGYLIALCGSAVFKPFKIVNPKLPLSSAIFNSSGVFGLYLMNRESCKVGFVPVENLNCYHVVNSFEASDGVYLDTLEFSPAKDLYSMLKLHPVEDQSQGARGRTFRDFGFETSVIRRVIDPEKLKVLRTETLFKGGFEFPWVVAHQRGKPYRFFYSIDTDGSKIVPVRFDTQHGSIQKFETRHEEILGEPIFIPSPTSCSNEEAGIVICFSKNLESLKTSVVLIDAQTMTEVSRAEIPADLPWPSGVHGVWDPSR